MASEVWVGLGRTVTQTCYPPKCRGSVGGVKGLGWYGPPWHSGPGRSNVRCHADLLRVVRSGSDTDPDPIENTSSSEWRSTISASLNGSSSSWMTNRVGTGIQHCGYVVAEVMVLQPETGRKQTERLLAYPRDIMVSSY